jgi:hypothetical protein
LDGEVRIHQLNFSDVASNQLGFPVMTARCTVALFLAVYVHAAAPALCAPASQCDKIWTHVYTIEKSHDSVVTAFAKKILFYKIKTVFFVVIGPEPLPWMFRGMFVTDIVHWEWRDIERGELKLKIWF